VGGLLAGATADGLGYGGAIGVVAGLTAASGLWVLRDMPAALDSAGAQPRALMHPPAARVAGAATPPDPH
jgi:hypothetical protein